MIGIYKITSPVGKIYIGQTTDWIKRQRQYKCIACKNQVKLYNSLLKYGVENHVFELIHECSKSKLNEMEIYYGKLFNSLNHYTGLNIRDFGSRGNHSEETKNIQKQIWKVRRESDKFNSISERTKRSLCQIGNKNNFGNRHKKKTKKGISDKLKKLYSKKENHPMFGRKHSDESKAKTSRIILDTQTGIFYIGTKEAAEITGKSHGFLSMQLRGERKNNTSFIYV